MEYSFSKDKIPDRLQITIGMLISWNGFPIAHQVFLGNTAEVNTFREALAQVRERFHLRKAILATDRGMVAERVLKENEGVELEYILGVKMRKIGQQRRYSVGLGATMRRTITSRSGK